MAQKKFPKRKTGQKGRKKKRIVRKHFFKKKRFRKLFNKKKVGKLLEIILTICVLSLAVVVLTHVLRWQPFAAPGPENVRQTADSEREEYEVLPAEEGPYGRPELIRDYIVENPYSRSGVPLTEVNGIVIHYVANPGSTARENRDYFENLKDTHLTKASSHFIIGLDGEIIQCIPLDEISYASNERNSDTISIECCHPGKNGKFNKKTYRSLTQLTAWLCASYGLTDADVIRHYDVTGKMCPKYFVKHEDAWMDFLSDIAEKLEKTG